MWLYLTPHTLTPPHPRDRSRLSPRDTQLRDAAQNFNTLWRPDHVLRVGYDGYGYNADATNVMHSPWNGEM